MTKQALASFRLQSPIVDFHAANFENSSIYLSGGSTTEAKVDQSNGKSTKTTVTLATVYRYDLNQNRWETAPRLNESRKLHSSCTKGGSLYVFAGQKGKDCGRGRRFVRSIEQLRVSRAQQVWTLIELDDHLTRIRAAICPINTLSILILGG